MEISAKVYIFLNIVKLYFGDLEGHTILRRENKLI